jgi:outer membrane lipase/esterase
LSAHDGGDENRDATQHALRYGTDYRNPAITKTNQAQELHDMPRTRLLAGAIVAGLQASQAASATQFSQVVVFGDSLSDAGNISLANAPQIQPPLRFTTNPGKTAAELVAEGVGHPISPSLAGGTDFAFGGAGVVNNSTAGPIPTLPQQLGMYLTATGGQADPNAL